MTVTPLQARSVFGGFLLVSAVMAFNMFYLQDHGGPLSGRQRAQKGPPLPPAAARSMPSVVQQGAGQSGSQAGDLGRNAGSSAMGHVGRFSPTSSYLGGVVLPDGEASLRMPQIVAGIQGVLARKGYEPGPTDGVVGLATRAAIMAYEHDHALPLTGTPSEPLLRHMQGRRDAVSPAGTHGGRMHRHPAAEQVLRTVQQALATLGYFSGRIDGQPGEATTRAIREFEIDNGLVPTGRVSAPLLARLSRTRGSGGAAGG